MIMEIAGHEFFSADGKNHLVRFANAARRGFLGGGATISKQSGAPGII